MLLLAFDTATPAITVALHDGADVLAERTTIDARRQGELLAPHIAEVLAQADVRAGRPDGDRGRRRDLARSPGCGSAS